MEERKRSGAVSSYAYEHLIRLLIEARKGKKVTQVELAALLETTQTFVSRYERLERRLDVVEFLEVMYVLGVDPHTVVEEVWTTIKKSWEV